MKTLKNFLKFLLLDSALLMIVMTLTLYTYPSNIMAQTNTETTEEQPEVYVPGEEFDDTLTKANEDPASGGIVGMVEQFVGIAFAAAAISSLIFENTPRSLIDCPTNQNAKITLRLMQAAALVNLLGEVKAKSEFKKAAKLATDNTFAVKQKEAEKNDNSEASKEARDKNNKQLEAYDTLVKVYEHKVKGIETKKSMATIAELALLGSLGTEVALTLGHRAMCATEQAANATTQATILTELGALQTAATTAAAVPATSAVCGPAVGLIAAVAGEETAIEAEQVALGTGETAVAEGESLLENTTFLAAMAAIVGIFVLKAVDTSKKEEKKEEYSDYNPLKYSNEAYEISRVLWNNIFTPFPEALAGNEMQMVMMAGVAYMLLEGQIGKDTIEGSTNDAVTGTALATEEAVWDAALAASTCPATSTIGVLNGQNKTSELMPIHCCGAKVTALTTNGYTATIPEVSVMDTEVDIYIQPLPLVGSNTFEFVKPAILNMIEQTYYATHFQDLHKKDPVQALAELKAFHQVLDTLEENFEEEIKNSAEIKKFDREFALWEQDENFDYMAKLGELKLELVEDAHAMGFGELLGFGFKLFMAIKLLKGFLRNTALPKPRNRMWTFGAAAAINAVIISFTGKKLSDNKKQLEVVKAERDRFAQSAGIQTGVGEEEASKKNAQNLAATESNSGGSIVGANFGGGITATCATGSPTTGFSPSPCTNSDQGDITGLDAARRNRLFSENSSIPLSFRNLPATVSSAVNASANGSDTKKPVNFNGLLETTRRETAAIKKDLDKLVKEFDATQPKSITTPDGKTQNIPGLGATIATLKKTFGGTPIGGTEGILDGTELTNDKEKTLASANYKAYKPAAAPNFNFQKANVGSLNYGSFSDDNSASTYGVDDVIEGKAEENLGDFKVDAGDIIDKPEVSIFKIISTRYLKNYEVLLSDKKVEIEEK